MPYEGLYSAEKSEALTRFSMIFARLYQIMDDVKDVRDLKNWVEWAKLDPSNVYYYVNQNSEELNDLFWSLRRELLESYKKLKELWVVKYDYILDVIQIFLDKIKIQI